MLSENVIAQAPVTGGNNSAGRRICQQSTYNNSFLKPAFYITSVSWLECVYYEPQVYQQITTRGDSL
jgi:hypothetical protein